jgi:hypothetical protein
VFIHDALAGRGLEQIPLALLDEGVDEDVFAAAGADLGANFIVLRLSLSTYTLFLLIESREYVAWVYLPSVVRLSSTCIFCRLSML